MYFETPMSVKLGIKSIWTYQNQLTKFFEDLDDSRKECWDNNIKEVQNELG